MIETIPLHATPSIRHRFHLLDALRGIAAVLVMVSHNKYIAGRMGLQSGFLAVDFFFCLSGFVIAASYENRLRSGLRIKDFLAARFIRLYPVYFFALGLALFLQLTVFLDLTSNSALVSFLLAIFLFPNLHVVPSIYAFPLNPPSWSLLMELVANLAYVLLIWLRLARSSILLLLALLAFALLSLLLFKGGVLYSFGDVHSDHHVLYGIARVVPSFFFGVLTLRLFQAGALHRSIAVRPFAAAVIAAALIAALESPLGFMQTNSFYLLCIAFIFPSLIWLGAGANPPSTTTKFCAALGDLSYPLYLIHIPLLEFANSRLFINRSSAFHLISSLGMMLLAILCSLLLAKKFDTPVRRILTDTYRKVSAPQAAPA